MLQNRLFKILSLLVIITLINGCSLLKKKEKLTVIQKEEVSLENPRPALPDKMSMKELEFKVIGMENIDQLKELEEKIKAGDAFFILTAKGYENLSLNMEEIKRFISQQESVIIYYLKKDKHENNNINNSTTNK